MVGKTETATLRNLKVGRYIYNFMKKILILVTSIATISCQNNVPKCDDPEVFETIYSIINENKNHITDNYGREVISEDINISSENTKISDIIIATQLIGLPL